MADPVSCSTASTTTNASQFACVEDEEPSPAMPLTGRPSIDKGYIDVPVWSVVYDMPQLGEVGTDDKLIDAYDWPSLAEHKHRILVALASRRNAFVTCIVCELRMYDDADTKRAYSVAYCANPGQPHMCAHDMRAYRHAHCGLELPHCVLCWTAYLDEASARQELHRVRMNNPRRLTYVCTHCMDKVDGVLLAGE